MVLFKCIYCKKEFNHKGNYLKHNELCKKRLEELVTKYKSYNKEILLKKLDLVTNSSSLEIYCEKYKCKNCEKIYKSYNGLKEHLIKNKCGKNKMDICDRIINNYNNKMVKVVNNTSNTYNTTNTNCNTNCNNNNNNTNITNNYNIQLMPYDEIKYDYMKESVLKQAFEILQRVNFTKESFVKCPGEAFQSITADTFFNPDNKENHVIYCPNLKDGQIHVYNRNKFSTDGWEVCLQKQTNPPYGDVVNKKQFFKEMIRRQMNTLEKIFKCNEDDDNILELTNITGFKNLLKEYNANDEVIKEYSAKLNTLCYKNNKIVKAKDTLIVKNT